MKAATPASRSTAYESMGPTATRDSVAVATLSTHSDEIGSSGPAERRKTTRRPFAPTVTVCGAPCRK